MTPLEEAKHEQFEREYFKSHREVPKGRNFLAWNMRYQNNQGYKGKFDETFPDAPGTRNRLDKDFCPKCGKRRTWCVCLDN